MEYFTKITSADYRSKNKLEEAAKAMALNKDRELIDESKLEEWSSDIKRRLKALCDYFHRCKPLNYNFEIAYNKKDYEFHCSEVFTITLYLIKKKNTE
jgi:hypothetical protein